MQKNNIINTTKTKYNNENSIETEKNADLKNKIETMLGDIGSETKVYINFKIPDYSNKTKTHTKERVNKDKLLTLAVPRFLGKNTPPGSDPFLNKKPDYFNKTDNFEFNFNEKLQSNPGYQDITISSWKDWMTIKMKNIGGLL